MPSLVSCGIIGSSLKIELPEISNIMEQIIITTWDENGFGNQGYII